MWVEFGIVLAFGGGTGWEHEGAFWTLDVINELYGFGYTSMYTYKNKSLHSRPALFTECTHNRNMKIVTF